MNKLNNNILLENIKKATEEKTERKFP